MGSGHRADRPANWPAARARIVQDALTILDAKRAQRGTANITAQGIQGVIARIIHDKGSRLTRAGDDLTLASLLTARGVDPAVAGIDLDAPGDTLEDDLLDVLNYALIAVALYRGWWNLPEDEHGP